MNGTHTHHTGLHVPDVLINALIAVESGGNDKAVGDGGKAVGPLQIHPIVVNDVNRIVDKGSDLVVFIMDDRWSREKSITMCRIYLGHYATSERLGRAPTIEDMARIWNGGPDGWKKPATTAYWAKVKAEINRSAGYYVSTIGDIDIDRPGQPPVFPAPAQAVNAEVPAPQESRTVPDHVAVGRNIAEGQFSSRAYREAQEREAWDRYASAYTANGCDKPWASNAAGFADALLAERRKRFPVEDAT